MQAVPAKRPPCPDAKTRIIRKPNQISLVSSLLHEHRTSYTVMILTVLVASTLTSAWVQVAWATGRGEGMPDLQTLNSYDRMEEEGMQEVARQISIMAACLCGFISIFLVITSVGFLIEGRRRQYAMMRLSGASPKRVQFISLLEFMIPLGLADLIGSLAGCLLVPVFAKALLNSGIERLKLVAHPHFEGLLISLGGILLACLVGTWLAVRRITSISPIEALQTSENRAGPKPIGPLRLLIALASLTGGLILVFLTFSGMDMESQIIAATGCLLVAVGALAPILVSICAGLIGIPFQLLSRGSGLLARQRARKESRSSTAIALPAILMLVIMTSVLILARAGWAQTTIDRYKPVLADALIMANADQMGDLNRKLLSSSDVESAITYSSGNWKTEDDGSDDSANTSEVSTMYVNKTGHTTETIQPVFIKGSPADLGPDKIAATMDWVQSHYDQNPLGRKVTLIDREDGKLVMTITALVDMAPTGLNSTYLNVDTNLDMLSPDPGRLTALVKAGPNVQADNLVKQLNNSWDRKSTKARTMKEHIRYDIGRSQEVQRALPKMVGGAIILTGIFLVQSCAIAISERRHENRRLYAAGISRSSLILSSIWEPLIDTLSGTLLSALVMIGVITIVFRKMSTRIDLSMVPLPYEYFGIMALCATALAALVSGLYAWFSSRADRTQK